MSIQQHATKAASLTAVLMLFCSQMAFAVYNQAVNITSSGEPIGGATVTLSIPGEEPVTVVDNSEDDDDSRIGFVSIALSDAVVGETASVTIEHGGQAIAQTTTVVGDICHVSLPPGAVNAGMDSDTEIAEKSSGQPLNHDPINIGPKSEIGGGIEKVVKEQVSGMVGGLLGGMLGGGIGFGSGSDDAGSSSSASDGPEMVDDPIDDKQHFTVPGTGIVVSLGGRINDDGTVLISQQIEDAPGKGTFQSASLMSMDYMYRRPKKYYWYETYLDWSLSVQYTHTHERYADGQLVERTVEQSDWMEIDSGSELIDSGIYGVSDDEGIRRGIWSMAGFNRATEGMNGMGTEFALSRLDMKIPLVYSLYITQPDLDPVTAVPLNVVTCPADDGDDLQFELVPDVLQQMKLNLDLKGGGMTRIDPPTMDLSAGDDRPVDSVVDDLQGFGAGEDKRDQNTPHQMANDQRYGKCTKAWLAERADVKRWDRGEKDQAGQDFMNAFIGAFGYNALGHFVGGKAGSNIQDIPKANTPTDQSGSSSYDYNDDYE